MSYRLISSNDIAIKYPEVNDMPCIYADLPNGMDGEHYVLEQELKTGQWIENAPEYQNIDPPYICSECGNMHLKKTNYCDQCGAKMVEPQESEE